MSGLKNTIAEQRRDCLEIPEDGHGSRSIIVISQLSIQQWHDSIGDSVLADAIMDRLVQNTYKINFIGESLQKNRPI